MESTLNERVAEEIRVQLARKNISASELARRAGMTQRSISRRITGEKAIDMDDLERIAKALGVPVAKLLPQETIAQSSSLAVRRRRVTARPAPASAARPPVRPGGATRPPASARAVRIQAA